MFASKTAFYFFLVQVIALQLTLANDSKGQELAEVKLSLDIINAQPEQVFQKLEALTPFTFDYNRNILPRQVRLTYHKAETNLKDILLDLAEKAELKFKRIGRQILVLKDIQKNDEPKIVTLPEKTITGRVTDGVSGEPLRGATIAVKEYPALGVTAGADGSYTLNVPDDAKTLVFSFVGYAIKEVRIGQRSIVNVQLQEELTDLDQVIVTGYKLQNQEAITLKKQSLAIGDFLSQDNIGRLPDFAAADAARRIAGVHTLFQEDEATQVAVRGLPPIYTYSTIDGMFLPSGSRTSRVSNFETIPSTAVSTIAVYKSRMADQDGNAIGGVFNLKTRSAFDVEDMLITGRATIGKYDFDEIPRSGQFRNTVDKNGPSIRSDVTISKRFGANKQFGIVASGSYNLKDRDEFKRPKRNYIFLNDNPDTPVPDRMYGASYDNQIERYGGFAKLEFKPNDNWYFTLSGNYFKKVDDEVRTENRFRNMVFDESSISLNGGRFDATRVDIAYDNFIITHKVSNMIFNTTYNSGNTAFDAKFGMTHGFLAEDGPWGGFSMGVDTGMSGSYTLGPDVDDVSLILDNPSFYTNPANWDSYYVGGRGFRDDEDAIVGQLNYAVNMGADAKGFGFKTGFHYRNIDHAHDRIDMSVNRDASVPLTFADFPLQDYFTSFFQGGQTGLLHFDTGAFEDWVATNTNVTGLDDSFGVIYNRAARYNLASRFRVDETVSAFYGKAQYRWDKLAIIAGLRYESTQTELMRVPSVNGDRDPNVTVTQDNDYDNLLPSINMVLNLTDDITIKAGYNKAIGRGDYTQIAPVTVIDAAAETRSIGNPELRPRVSDNYDIAMEHYFDQGSSLFSFGFFHKNIKDDIVSDSFFDPTDGYRVTTNVNGLGVAVSGLEVNIIKSDFKNVLPGFLSNLGVSSNFTFIESRREISANQFTAGVASVPRTIMNTQLFYQTDKFDARLAFNHVGRYVKRNREQNASDGINDDEFWDPFSQLDFAANYYFSKNYSLFVEARNFTNANRGFTRGTNLLIEDTEFGGSVWLGVTFKF